MPEFIEHRFVGSAFITYTEKADKTTSLGAVLITYNEGLRLNVSLHWRLRGENFLNTRSQ